MTGLHDVNSLDEAAAYLRVPPSALARLARAGKIGSLKTGKTRTFPRECLEAYVAENTTPATPPNPHGLTDRAAARIRGRV